MASADGTTPRRVTVSSDQLPPGADDRTHRRWFEEIIFECGEVDYAFAPDRPRSWRLDFATFGPVVVNSFRGTLTGVARTTRHVAADGRDDFCVGVIRRRPVLIQSRGRDTVHTPSSMTLLSLAEPGDVRHNPFADCSSIFIPRTQLSDLVAGADDLLNVPFDRRLPAVQLLRGYLDLVLAAEHVADPPLAAHIATTLTDLAALALGAGRDAAELAQLRGRRAARVALVVAAIRAGFADPGCSPGTVAASLGLSPRSLQDLLHNTGRTFTERVLELRLQKARAMLTDPGHQHQRVSEIAYAVGFDDVSYFNRCVRRRYGATPSDLRAKPRHTGRPTSPSSRAADDTPHT